MKKWAICKFVARFAMLKYLSKENAMSKRLFVALGVIIVFIIAFNSNLFDFMTFANLKLYGHELRTYVGCHYWKTVLIYWLVYVVSVTLSFPWASIMTLAGGYMFGMTAILYIITATTLGAIGAFLIARYVLGDYLHKKYGKFLKRFNDEMAENGGWYLFTIRLIPIIPFFIVNSLAGLTKISFHDYVWSTSLGMILPTSVIVFAGMGLATIHSVNDIFSWKVLLAFGLMITFSFMPLIYKKCLLPRKEER